MRRCLKQVRSIVRIVLLSARTLLTRCKGRLLICLPPNKNAREVSGVRLSCFHGVHS